MQRTRFFMIGGFLGAGKTTAIARAGHALIRAGYKVGFVTNDQAQQLVDTQLLQAEGFNVGEVAGACFCCKFNDLVDTIASLHETQQPDVILAEPVGSCTDLVATVVQPLHRLYGDRYQVAPYVVLLKPEHGRKILAAGQAGSGFSAKAAYIFRKQIEEADVVAINKVDKLSADERSELVELLKAHYPEKEVLCISARRGDGFDRLLDVFQREQPHTRTTPEVDYDIYAEGEAELGWLNCRLTFVVPSAAQPDAGSCEAPGPVLTKSTDQRRTTAEANHAARTFSIDALLVEFVEAIARQLRACGGETAHLKVLAADGTDSAIANLVASDVGVELSKASQIAAQQVQMTINARVAIDPAQLTEIVREAAAAIAGRHTLEWRIANVQSFRPGRPVPTHRMQVSPPG